MLPWKPQLGKLQAWASLPRAPSGSLLSPGPALARVSPVASPASGRGLRGLLAPALALGAEKGRRCGRGRHTLKASEPEEAEAEVFGGKLEAEVLAAVEVVQQALLLVQALACDMEVAPASAGKELEACYVTAGVAVKEGDSTPVTAADYAIQGLVSATLKRLFPSDRFMGEEDATDLREDPDLCEMALDLCTKFGGPMSRDIFLAAVDAGVETDKGQRRVWVLDPIDGTKGFVTGEGYVIGLALLVDGEPIVGVMGYPNATTTPPIMAAVKGCGLRWWPSDGPMARVEPSEPEWSAGLSSASDEAEEWQGDFPPWLVSPQLAGEECRPFGDGPSSHLCCGSMIKYFAVAAGSHCGYVQYEEDLKTWDHACGVICVQESGGEVTDGASRPVRFPGRRFRVYGGIVSCSRWTPPAIRHRLRKAAAGNAKVG
ncbi:unnamed protein product [Effrenium voratum]|nr:unnamed protein product [Effrenium voratum]